MNDAVAFSPELLKALAILLPSVAALGLALVVFIGAHLCGWGGGR